VAFSTGSSSSSGSGRLQTASTTLAEINVTPLVDVMLVLLVVFMISAPLMQQGVQVDLPKANAQTLSEVPEQITLVVDKQKRISMNKQELAPGTLRTKLEAIAAAKPGVEVFIQADQTVAYGFIVQVMAEVKRAKISRVGMVTEPADPNARL
jgi:biopolymer transport protein TolR